MKQNVSETKSNWYFQKKCKSMSTKQESVSDTTFKAWPFSSSFNLASKHGGVNTATCQYFPLVVGPTITNCCKRTILNIGKFLDPSLKTLACMKTSPVLCENQSFFYYFKMWLPLLKVIKFFCFLLQHDEVFLISLLDGCYHYLVFMDPINDCSKSKLPVVI